MPETFRQKLSTSFKQTFGAGLLFLVPLVLTLWMLTVLVGWIDSAILVLPRKIGIEDWFLFQIPGIGIILAVIIVLSCGFLARNYMGNVLVLLWDRLMNRVPYVGPFYKAIKQLVQAIVGSGSTRRFGRVVLVEYPRKGAWAMAFVTNEQSAQEISTHFDEPLIHLFLPTSPNPTSGFVLVVPKKDVKDLNMRVDDAFKLIISGGIVRSGEDFHETITAKAESISKP
jgi:uncharacterized membrane protein